MLINGAYGHRAKKILDIARRKVVVHETPEDTPPDLAAVERMLKATPRSRTSSRSIARRRPASSIRSRDIGALAQKYRKSFLLDSMSAFGALPLDAQALKPDAIAASSNKCIEGVPGLGFVICRKAALEKTAGNATTLVLDLHDQWTNFEKTGQYRFTPPIHVIVSFHQALTEFFDEGGQPGRGKRYAENCRVLIDGMRALGFEPLLARQSAGADHRHVPHAGRSGFRFQAFYDALKERGYVIYPGKLTVADSFRIGCIGRLYPDHMRGALAAIRDILDEMGVNSLKPAKAACMNIQRTPTVSVNGRDYRFPKRRRSASASTARSPATSSARSTRALRRISRG